MHKGIWIAVACVLGMGTAHAQDKPKRFSLEFSVGPRSDMAGLGRTITIDGTADTAETTLANAVYSIDKAVMSDQRNLLIWHNSDSTNSAFRLLGEEPEVGGAMLGISFGGSARYDLVDFTKVPLYVRAGFYYSTRVLGGHQTRVLGDAAMRSNDIANLLMANGHDPADYIGGTMVSDYGASWIEVPVSIGIALPLRKNDPYTQVYGGFGLSFFRGGFEVEIEIDERYANVLGTHIDTEALTVTNYSPGAVKDDIDFTLAGMGLNWSLGAQATLGVKGLVAFMELNASGTSGTVYSQALSPNNQRLFTAATSETLANEDPQWFKRLAYTVVTAGPLMRTGIRYYFF